MAGLDLSAMASRTPIPDDRITWEKVLTKLKSGQMPPPGRPRPNEAELRTVSENLEDALGAVPRRSDRIQDTSRHTD